ncbi:MAG: 1-acyl-sn-glycerol-3-phosphate acyltransferase [Clostridia bacterium]|nr:1-acyl-sn-glycerol-3-phosphate acyltransferase [Clostridia bacterium]
MSFDYSKVKEYGTYDAVRGLAKIVCKKRYNITYVGQENIPSEGGFILACNHQDALDPLVIANGCKRVIHFMAKEELFEKPVIAGFLKRLNAFPVKRGDGDMSALKYARNVVENGWVLGIFPEGTRSKDYKPTRGKSGVALIAKQTGADILPVSIYTDEQYKKGTRLTVRFGKIIKSEELSFLEDHSAKELRAASKRIMGDITALWEEGHCEK